MMRMLLYVPTCALLGVPVRRPVVASKNIHDGLLIQLKVSGSPSGSDAVGVKLNDWPTVIEVGGVPPMIGGELVGWTGVTVSVKAGSDEVEMPSVTEITMPL